MNLKILLFPIFKMEREILDDFTNFICCLSHVKPFGTLNYYVFIKKFVCYAPHFKMLNSV